ncbi:hypothetical protein ACHAXS_003301 [Conticribra weissflogii]
MVFYKRLFSPKGSEGDDTVETKSILRRNSKYKNTVRSVSWSESFDTRDVDYTFEDERADEESVIRDEGLIADFNWVYNGESMYTYNESLRNDTATNFESVRDSISEDNTTFVNEVSMSSDGDDAAIEVTRLRQELRPVTYSTQEQPALDFHNLACASSVSEGTLNRDRYKLDDVDFEREEDQVQEDETFQYEEEIRRKQISETKIQFSPQSTVKDTCVFQVDQRDEPKLQLETQLTPEQMPESDHEPEPEPIITANPPIEESSPPLAQADEENAQVEAGASVFVPGEAVPVNLEFQDEIMDCPSETDSLTVGSIDSQTLNDLSFDENRSWVDRRVNSDDSLVSLKKRDTMYHEVFEQQNQADSSHGHIGLILPFMNRFNCGAFMEEQTMFSWDVDALKSEIKPKTNQWKKSKEKTRKLEKVHDDLGADDSAAISDEREEPNEKIDNNIENEKPKYENVEDDMSETYDAKEQQVEEENRNQDEEIEEQSAAIEQESQVLQQETLDVNDYQTGHQFIDDIVDTDTYEDDDYSNQIGQVIAVEQTEKEMEAMMNYRSGQHNTSGSVDDSIPSHNSAGNDKAQGKNYCKRKKRRGPIAFLRTKVFRAKSFKKGTFKTNSKTKKSSASESRKMCDDRLHDRVYQENLPTIESCYTTESILNELQIIENTAKLMYQERIMGSTTAKHNEISSLFNPDDEDELIEPNPPKKKRARPFAWLSNFFFSKFSCDNDDYFGCDEAK